MRTGSRQGGSLYRTQFGYRLFQARSYGSAIAAYRARERQLLIDLLRDKTRLIEIGCGKGEHLPVASERRLAYWGIDPSEVFLREGARKYRHVAGDVHWLCASAEDLTNDRLALHPEGRGTLCFVPFNCLGNVEEVDAVLRSIAKLDAQVMISVFAANSATTLRRLEYYRRSGHRCNVAAGELGIKVTSDQGLRSRGFWPQRLRRRARKFGLETCIVRLTNIAFALVSQGS